MRTLSLARTRRREKPASAKALKFIALCALLVMVMARAAAAKTRPAVTVDLPFEFIVANQTLPAGNYQIQTLLQAQPGTDSIEILALRNTAGRIYRAVVADLGPEVVSQSGTELSFRRYRGQTYLAGVRSDGKLLTLHPSLSELALREKNSEGETVMLAVRSSNGL